MKKILSTVLVLGLAFVSIIKSDDGKKLSDKGSILSVDREALFSRSKEGKAFLVEQEGNKTTAEREIRGMEEAIRGDSQRLEKQVTMLTRDALTERQRKLAKDIRNLERKREDAQQDLKLNFQLGYEKIREKQSHTVEKVFKEKDAKLLVDRNTPGVLAVAADTDITNEVLKKLDVEFEKSVVKKETA